MVDVEDRNAFRRFADLTDAIELRIENDEKIGIEFFLRIRTLNLLDARQRQQRLSDRVVDEDTNVFAERSEHSTQRERTADRIAVRNDMRRDDDFVCGLDFFDCFVQCDIHSITSSNRFEKPIEHAAEFELINGGNDTRRLRSARSSAICERLSVRRRIHIVDVNRHFFFVDDERRIDHHRRREDIPHEAAIVSCSRQNSVVKRGDDRRFDFARHSLEFACVEHDFFASIERQKYLLFKLRADAFLSRRRIEPNVELRRRHYIALLKERAAHINDALDQRHDVRSFFYCRREIGARSDLDDCQFIGMRARHQNDEVDGGSIHRLERRIGFVIVAISGTPIGRLVF